MIIRETEAKEKLCPMAMGRDGKTAGKCKGPACMAWRLVYDDFDFVRKGYGRCGLAYRG